jgi:hypothetical protein
MRQQIFFFVKSTEDSVNISSGFVIYDKYVSALSNDFVSDEVLASKLPSS